jgi:hypothetical protein
MFVKSNINTRVNMQMTSNTQRGVVPKAAPVAQASAVLMQSTRSVVKPMLVAPHPQKKGCRSCGS